MHGNTSSWPALWQAGENRLPDAATDCMAGSFRLILRSELLCMGVPSALRMSVAPHKAAFDFRYTESWAFVRDRFVSENLGKNQRWSRLIWSNECQDYESWNGLGREKYRRSLA
jgi:hypothetical protein